MIKTKVAMLVSDIAVGQKFLRNDPANTVVIEIQLLQINEVLKPGKLTRHSRCELSRFGELWFGELVKRNERINSELLAAVGSI